MVSSRSLLSQEDEDTSTSSGNDPSLWWPSFSLADSSADFPATDRLEAHRKSESVSDSESDSESDEDEETSTSGGSDPSLWCPSSLLVTSSAVTLAPVSWSPTPGSESESDPDSSDENEAGDIY